MGSVNVLYKNKYNRFSDITNSFLVKAMTKRRYENWRKKEYGPDCSLNESYFITIEEAVNMICSNREYRDAIKVLREAKFLDKYTQGLVIDYYLDI